MVVKPAEPDQRSAIPTSPSIDLPKPDDPLVPSIPGPPTPEQLRARYLQLQEELSRHMSAVQVKQKVDELERELAAARDKAQKAARENFQDLLWAIMTTKEFLFNH